MEDRIEANSTEKLNFTEVLNPEQSVIAISTTYFPKYDPKNKDVSDSIRGNLALESIEQLNKKGIDVSIVDVGSSPIFLQMVSQINSRRFSDVVTVRKPATLNNLVDLLEVKKESQKKGEIIPGFIWFLSQKEKGYSQSRVNAIKNVTDIIDNNKMNKEVIVQLEMEKTQLVNEIFKITRPINEGKADIVIPDRGIRVKKLGDQYDNFCNYPKFQAVSERKANFEIHQMLVDAGLRKKNDAVLDLFGGTRALKNTLELKSIFGQTFEIPKNSPFWDKVKPEKYSNAVYFPIYLAMALNKRVESVPIEFTYPSEQSEIENQNKDEFMDKREKQFSDIVTGSDLLINFLEKERGRINIKGKNTLDKILHSLKNDSVVKLEGLKWTDHNEFNESWFYMGEKSPIFTNKLINDKNVIKYLDRTLDSFFSKADEDRLILTHKELENTKKFFTLLKSEIEKRGKAEKSEEIYEKYHIKAMDLLYNSTQWYYQRGDLESSQDQFTANFFAKFVKLPKYYHIQAVITATPFNEIKKVFDSLTDDLKISEKEKREIVYRYNKELLKNAMVRNDVNFLERVEKGARIGFNISLKEIEKIKKEIQSENPNIIVKI